MVLKQGSASLVPLGAYALAAVTWFSGSQRIYQEQLQQLEQYEQALKADGSLWESRASSKGRTSRRKTSGITPS